MKKLVPEELTTGIVSRQGNGPKPVHSEKLTRMLTAHRTAAVQVVMIDRPEVALAALSCAG